MTTVAALYVDPRGPYPRMTAYGIPLRAPDGVTLIGYRDRLLSAVDCWDITRDARRYDGPHSVVAHPPCRHWSRLSHMAHVECAGPYNGPRDPGPCGWSGKLAELRNGCCPVCGAGWYRHDADCAPRAVEQVRRWGGVLEHPAGSKLWDECGLPAPLRCICCAQEGDCRLKPHTNCGRPARDIMCDGWPDSLPLCVDCQPLAEFTVFPCGDPWGGYTIELDQVEWGHVARKPTWLYLVGVPREALEAPPFPGREPTHYIGGGRTPSSRKGGAIPPGMKAASKQQKERTPPLFAEYLVRLARSVRR